MRIERRFVVVALLGLVTLGACDSTPALAGLGCQPEASLSPGSAAIHVADTIRLATTIDAGCPSPLLRNDTPTVIRLDSISAGTFRVTGLTVGTGRLRALSPVDTTVSAAATITVSLP